MIAGSRQTGAFDWEAILRGALWGLLFMVLVAVTIALLEPIYPALAQFYYLNDDVIRWIMAGLAAFISGVVAGQRAGTLGLLHGSLAAVISFLMLALLSGVLSGTPNVFDLGLRIVVAIAAGGVGGILGANLAD